MGQAFRVWFVLGRGSFDSKMDRKDIVTNEEVFDLLMKEYGYLDIVVWVDGYGFIRWRGYHDGGWLEGYQTSYIHYWGA